MEQTIKLVLQGEFTTFNEYDKAARTHRQVAAEMKQEETERVWAESMSQKNRDGLRIEKYPVKVHFDWYRINKSFDPDNIAFAKKYILDGLQESGLMTNDGWNQVAGFSDDFHIDKDYPRVEVTISW